MRKSILGALHWSPVGIIPTAERTVYKQGLFLICNAGYELGDCAVMRHGWQIHETCVEVTLRATTRACAAKTGQAPVRQPRQRQLWRSAGSNMPSQRVLFLHTQEF